MSGIAGRIVIYGGKGALGSTCVQYFKSKAWWVASIDLVANDQADVAITVPDVSVGCTEQSSSVLEQLGAALQGNKVDAVICVAGGWAGGNAANKDFINNSDLMLKQSVWSSLIAANIASLHGKEESLLVLTGAKAALEPTPGMIGYGLAKASVHHLVKSLAADKSGLPAKGTALAILPVTLDTPMNRKWMPKADFSTWTPLEFVAETCFKWAKNEGRPRSGALVQVVTKDGKTELISD